VVDYDLLCTGNGGVDGWMASAQPWEGKFLSVYSKNDDGFASSASLTVKPYMMSMPQYGATTPYKNGCSVAFTLRSYPQWGNSAMWSAFVLESNAGGSGYQGGISFDDTTGQGLLYIPYSFFPQTPGYLDENVVPVFDVGRYVGGNFEQRSTATGSSLPSVSCPTNPSGAEAQSAQPEIEVTSNSTGFNVDWSVSNTGSHPVKEGRLMLFSSETSNGPVLLQYTQAAPSLADIDAYCRNPIDTTNFNLAFGYEYNMFCTNPMGQEIQITSASLKTSGSISSDTLRDSWGNPIPIVAGRTYWVSLRLETFLGQNNYLAKSSTSELVEVNPAAAPTVTAVNPTSGPTTGGTSVTITGTGFRAGATATIGGENCTNVLVSATSLTCETSSAQPGQASVEVTNSDGQSNVANTLFTYVAPPSVSPSTQTVSGTAGTAVAASTAFTPNNFTGAVSYAVTSGTLPAGLAISSSTGVISGTPSAASTASVTITATGATAGSATATVTFAIAAATTTTTTAPATTTPATTAAPVGPVNVTSSNQATLTQTPGAATAVVNGQPVTVAVETPADLPAAQVDPEDRSPAQVAALQTAADNLVSQLNQSAGGNSGLAVQDTPTGAAITGLLDKPVPIENTVLVEAGTKSTLFAALNQDGSVTEVQPGAVIEVLGDGQVGVVASGLTPGETAEFVIMSTPTLLGSYTVSANGTIKAQTSLPDGIGLGNHTLVVASPTVQASLGLKVSATPSTLPATGASSSNTMQIALFLMVGGLMVAFLRRRRHILN
jgi:LPXTG-motif cell wall-anchored protein